MFLSGPGGSSIEGLFTELGPCLLSNDSLHTYINPNSWSNNASVLFLDQPAGTGLSTVAPGTPFLGTHLEAAIDFQTLLNTFFHRIFPNYSDHPIHIAGESFGGHYVPTYTYHILKSREFNSRDAFWGNITSLILVDALIDGTAPSLGEYELLCKGTSGPLLNAIACAEIAKHVHEYQKLGTTV